MNEVHYTVEFTLKQRQADTFRSLADECIEIVQEEEPGTRTYEWYMSEDGSTCHLEESFQDTEAMRAHLGGRVVSEVLPRLLQVADITSFDVHGELDEQTREALANFGTRNFAPIAGFSR